MDALLGKVVSKSLSEQRKHMKDSVGSDSNEDISLVAEMDADAVDIRTTEGEEFEEMEINPKVNELELQVAELERKVAQNKLKTLEKKKEMLQRQL